MYETIIYKHNLKQIEPPAPGQPPSPPDEVDEDGEYDDDEDEDDDNDVDEPGVNDVSLLSLSV